MNPLNKYTVEYSLLFPLLQKVYKNPPRNTGVSVNNSGSQCILSLLYWETVYGTETVQ